MSRFLSLTPRMLMRTLAVTVVLLSAFTLIAPHASAAEPGWSPVIIATGDYRRQIESTPIEQRPYRPLHFYGNTVRRMHYRGNFLPIPRGVTQGVRPARRMNNLSLVR